MLIRVTEKHIAKGKPGSCTDCPIALGIAEALPDIPMVTVGTVGGHLIRVGDSATFFPLSAAAMRFIRAFDNKRPVKPFNFKLETKC